MGKNKEQKLKEHILDRMWTLSGSLKGIGTLLQQQNPNPAYCYEHDELFGLGQLLKLLSDELSKIEDTLRCGQESMMDEFLKNEKDS